MLYLRIENPGVAPVEGFTVLGVSTTRKAGRSDTIGQFGTGSKQAVGVLLRKGIQPVVFCDRLKLEFYAKPTSVNDGLATYDYGQVVCLMSGKDQDGKRVKREQPLGFVVEHGAIDWTEISMGLREFVSNALDRATRETGSHKAAIIDVVNEASIVAKPGTTRIYVPVTPEVQQFYTELPKRFLHFTEGGLPTEAVLEKRGRGLGDAEGCAMVYKQGVFVAHLNHDRPSLFDYNLNGLDLDECRNASHYMAKHNAGIALGRASVSVLTRFLKSINDGEQLLEHEFHGNILSYDSDDLDVRKRWNQAWKLAYGEKAVAYYAVVPALADHLRKRGFDPIPIPDRQMGAIQAMGIPNDLTILGGSLRSGREKKPASAAAQNCLDRVWAKLTEYGVTNGRSKPAVSCFRTIMEGSSETRGYYDRENAEVCVSDAFATADTHDLRQTMLEEVAHHVTGSGDISRDFQDYAFRLATLAMFGD